MACLNFAVATIASCWNEIRPEGSFLGQTRLNFGNVRQKSRKGVLRREARLFHRRSTERLGDLRIHAPDREPDTREKLVPVSILCL